MLVTYNEHLLPLSCSLLFLCLDCGLICFVVYGCGVLVGLDACFVVLVVCGGVCGGVCGDYFFVIVV